MKRRDENTATPPSADWVLVAMRTFKAGADPCPLRAKSRHRRMSALWSALPPKADIAACCRHVRFVPRADFPTAVGYYCWCVHWRGSNTHPVHPGTRLIGFRHGPSAANIFTSGCWGGRPPGSKSRCWSGNLSVPAGSSHRWRRSGQCSRRRCPPDCAIARRAAWPILRRRESQWRQWQSRHRGSRARRAGRPHAAASLGRERDQHVTLRESQFRFDS